MTRYCVNATVEVDAWAYVEADNELDALEKARALSVSDFETGEGVFVGIVGVELLDD